MSCNHAVVSLLRTVKTKQPKQPKQPEGRADGPDIHAGTCGPDLLERVTKKVKTLEHQESPLVEARRLDVVRDRIDLTHGDPSTSAGGDGHGDAGGDGLNIPE